VLPVYDRGLEDAVVLLTASADGTDSASRHRSDLRHWNIHRQPNRYAHEGYI